MIGQVDGGSGEEALSEPVDGDPSRLSRAGRRSGEASRIGEDRGEPSCGGALRKLLELTQVAEGDRGPVGRRVRIGIVVPEETPLAHRFADSRDGDDDGPVTARQDIPMAHADHGSLPSAGLARRAEGVDGEVVQDGLEDVEREGVPLVDGEAMDRHPADHGQRHRVGQQSESLA